MKGISILKIKRLGIGINTDYHITSAS